MSHKIGQFPQLASKEAGSFPWLCFSKNRNTPHDLPLSWWNGWQTRDLFPIFVQANPNIILLLIYAANIPLISPLLEKCQFFSVKSQWSDPNCIIPWFCGGFPNFPASPPRWALTWPHRRVGSLLKFTSCRSWTETAAYRYVRLG